MSAALRRVRMGLMEDAREHAARRVPPADWAMRVIQDRGVRNLYQRYATPEQLAREVRAIVALVYRM